LGDKVTLEGWKGYRGDLDVNQNKNGEYSVYTKLHNEIEVLQPPRSSLFARARTHSKPSMLTVGCWYSPQVMFHVSTYLPYDAFDPQQIPRKKYIGNDLVTIVFLYVLAPLLRKSTPCIAPRQALTHPSGSRL